MLVSSRALAPDPDRSGRVALRGGGTSITYRELRERAAEVALRSGSWSDHADRRSPFLAVLSDWTPEFVCAFLGLASAGWAVGVLDPSWSAEEVRGALAQLDPCAVLVADAFDGSIGGGWRRIDRAGPGWSVLAADEPRAPRPAPAASPDAVFYVGFTSGSSGRPKAFMRSHRSWWESFEGLSGLCPLATDGSVLVPGPLSSSHFLFGALHGLHAGAIVELVSRTDHSPGRLARRMGGGDPLTAVYVVPTMLAQAATGDGGDPGARLDHIFCAGARLEPELRALTGRRFPRSRLVEYYGASELSFVTIQVPGDGSPAGSVGRAFPGVEISIRDEMDRVVPAGEPGVIFARGNLVFTGYRGEAPASAARRLDGGWWTVGDRGRLDAEGNLFIVGRGTSLIISGGANVQPEEVEEVLGRCPGVAGCVVVGLPDERWGEVVCAVIDDGPGGGVTRAELRGLAAGALAPFKRPRRYVRLDRPIPLSRTGKVDRPRVRELVMGAGAVSEVR